MKPISTEAQRIIAWIPGLNLLCLPMFIYNSFFAKFTFKDYLRSWRYLVFPAIIVAILQKTIICIFPSISIGFEYTCTYLILLIVGLRLVDYQEHYM